MLAYFVISSPQAAVQIPTWLAKLILVERCIAIVMVTYALVRYLQFFWSKR